MAINKRTWNNRKNRVIAGILTLAVTLGGIPFFPAYAASKAEVPGKIEFGDSVINYNQSLMENGDGQYTFTLDLNTAYAASDKNVNSREVKRGYFTAAKSGSYLIELWGGDGGNGTGTSYNDGGTGGKGGHVYGTVHLNVGETLFWQLGGNGFKATNVDQGGGANGPGGGHGSVGSFEIGGGGGYSAVYKFEPNTFESAYTDGSGNINTELHVSDRVSKYIMIAGGGGGGGAGNGWAPGTSVVGSPHGGNGGSMDSLSGQLTGDGYDVSGTFFTGADGKSSGTSTEFVGRGGSNKPGAIADSMWSWFAGKQPNDWRGTYNENYRGGAGGAGNLRGGGGGAGFCGGSGGVMTSIVSPGNVGGGGGGSSFIADSVNYSNLSSVASAKLKNTNPSETGGAVQITYLGSNNLDDLKDLSLTFDISKYFDIETVTIDGEFVTEGNAELIDENTFRLKNIDLTMNSDGTAKDQAKIQITVSRKVKFAGGNNVPVFSNMMIGCSNKNASVSIPISADCGYLNIPLNFKLTPHSYISNIAGKVYEITDLYRDNYADVRSYLQGSLNEIEDSWAYDFIQNISNIYITDHLFNPVTGNTVAPLGTTNYHVTMDVTPKNTGVAKVGSPVTKTSLFAHAIITITSDKEEEVNGNRIYYSKHLTYDSTSKQYIMALDITADSILRTVVAPEPFEKNYMSNGNTDDDLVTDHREITASGYYFIEAWGGDGGAGGKALNDQRAEGGEGGYIAGTIHLNKGDIVKIELGGNGKDGNETRESGKGGNATIVSYADKNNTSQFTALMAAAGGGGGGGGSVALWAGGNGGNVDNNDVKNSYVENGHHGIDGEGGGLFQTGAGGAAGRNYKNLTLMDTKKDPGDNSNNLTSKIPGSSNYDNSVNGGNVKIVCIQVDVKDTEASEEAELDNYMFSAHFSKYFTVDPKNVKIVNLVEDNEGTEVTGYDVTPSAIVTDGHITITNIDPKITTTTTGDGINCTTVSEVDFRIKIPFTPRKGFFGGNDVKVLIDKIDGCKQAGCETGMEFGQTLTSGAIDTFAVPEKLETDYANVELNRTLIEDYLGTLTTYHVNRPQGNTATHRLELYTWNHEALPIEPEWATHYVKEDVVITLQDTNKTVVNDDPIAPEVSTHYDVVAGIVPIKAADYATVVESVEGVTIKPTGEKGDAAIHVTSLIRYDIGENLTTDATVDRLGNAVVTPGEPHSAVLTAKDGYKLPEQISVTYDSDETPVPHTYDPFSGQLRIEGRYIRDAITIEAVAESAEYLLYYHYEVNGVDGKEWHTTTRAVTAGTDLRSASSDSGIRFDLEYIAPKQIGHTFKWHWGTQKNEPPETMPAEDWYAIGYYVPNPYDLTVKYVYEDGKEAASPTVSAVLFGTEYSIVSPEIEGYLADQPVVSGTYTTDNAITIKVTYKGTQNQLNIIYIQNDSNTVYRQYQSTVGTGEKYSVSSPAISGYTPDQAVISGTMDKDGETYYVYYTPNTYTLTLNPDGGSVQETTRKVTFNNVYLWDAESQSYENLPTPIKLGHNFAGWYLNGKKITEDTRVETAGDHEVVASWAAIKFKVTVNYVGERNVPLNTDIFERDYGESYTVNFPATIVDPHGGSYNYELKDPSVTSASGIMGAQNVVINVEYVKTHHTLTIHYLYDDSVSNHELHGNPAAPSTVRSLENGASYEVHSPTVENFTPSQAVVSGTMGMEDRTITVLYLDKQIQISVTVNWSDLTFSYSHGIWNPESHQYSKEPIKPSESNSNRITVTNNSDIGVSVDFAYEPVTEYKNVTAYFTQSDQSNGQKNTHFDLGTVDSKSAWIWLEGDLPEDATGTVQSGTCKVTITGGGGSHAL